MNLHKTWSAAIRPAISENNSLSHVSISMRAFSLPARVSLNEIKSCKSSFRPGELCTTFFKVMYSK